MCPVCRTAHDPCDSIVLHLGHRCWACCPGLDRCRTCEELVEAADMLNGECRGCACGYVGIEVEVGVES